MPKKLPVLDSMPVTAPTAYDNSMLDAHKQCPRYAWYRYWLHRSPVEKSYPITFGVAYHRYREVLDLARIQGQPGSDEIHTLAFSEALKVYGDDEPAIGHKHEFQTKARLLKTCEQGYSYWLQEPDQGYEVLEAEQSFQVALPGSGELYGGRMDWFGKWNGRIWIKDYKTTSRMGRTYANQFDPRAQFSGYVWGAAKLSGQPVQGMIVETVYNTKNIGPKHESFLSTRTEFALDEWIDDTEEAIVEINRWKDVGYFPKRTTACMNFGGCYFRGCCTLSNWSSREAWLENHTEFKVWDFMKSSTEKGKDNA